MRRTLAWVMVAGLVTGALTGIATVPGGADPCPVVAPGHWSGTGHSNILAVDFSISTNFVVHADNTTSGSYSVNGGGSIPFVGSIACNVGTFQTLDAATIFGGGLLSPDGRSMTSGTYTAPGDNGTWSLTADPYVLSPTSTVQPTTISPGGASSWVLDVKNTGTAAATLVDADLSVSGAGVFGSLSQSTVSQGTGCSPDSETSGLIHCDLGTILAGATASVTVPVVSTGAAGSSISVDGSAASAVGGGTDGSAPTATISVVAPAGLPPGEVSGIALPGVKLSTPGKATPTNPIVVQFKLPKKVARGTTNAGVSASAAVFNASALVKGPSVPMSILRSAVEAGTFCGGQACSGDVIHLTSFSGYNDPKRPAKLTITWDASVKGRGKASAMFKRGDARTATTRTLPTCIKAPTGYLNLPCVSKRKQAGSGDVSFTLLLLSGDPKFGRR